MWAYLKRLVAAMGVLACCGGAWGETTIIDDFSDGATFLEDSGVDEDTGLTGAIGGVRRVENPWPDGDVVINSDPYPAYFRRGPFFGQAHVWMGANFGRMDLSYGNKTSAGSDLNLDWRSGGTVTVNVAEFHWRFRPFRYSTTINAGGIDYVYEGSTSNTVEIALSEFRGADLSDIDGLHFSFVVIGVHIENIWLTLDSIETDAVPEPPSLLLLSLALPVMFFHALRLARRQMLIGRWPAGRRNTNMYMKTCVAAMGMLACCGVAWGETTIIDDFSDGATFLEDSGVDEDTGLTGAIGGVRRVGNPWDDGDVVVNSDPYPAYLDRGPFFGQAYVWKGWNVGHMDLSYGNKTSAGTDLNLDWRSGGTVMVNVAKYRNNIFFFYSLTVNAGGMDHVIEYPYHGSLPETLEIELSEFGGVDLSDVDGLQFSFRFAGPNAGSGWLTLDSIETDAVPEPPSLLLLSLALPVMFFHALRLARRQK